MLVLERRKNESILIGDDIRITIIDSKNDSVKLGFEAPRNISILREELSTIESENKAAVNYNYSAICKFKDALSKKIQQQKQ